MGEKNLAEHEEQTKYHEANSLCLQCSRYVQPPLVPQGQQKIPVFKEIIKDSVHPYMQPHKGKFHHNLALWSKENMPGK